MQPEFDISVLAEQLLQSHILEYSLQGSDDPFLRHLGSFTHRVLSEIDLLFLNEPIFVIQSELITNYLKACAKRVLFHDLNLNLNDEKDYAKGMQQFRTAVLEKWDAQSIRLAENAMQVRLEYRLTNEGLHITFKNNVEISPFEYERIKKRLNFDLSRVGLEPEFTGNIDHSEGGGLGLILINILLQNTGIGISNLKFHADKTGTTTTLLIPRHIARPSIEHHLSEHIIGRIEALPSFPERIRQLMDLCESRSAGLSQIADQIGHDPSLTAQILKLACSAGYITRIKNPSLLEGVQVIGLQQVKNFLLVAGVRNILTGLVSKERMEEIWKMSNRISFFAGQLVRGRSEIKDAVIVSALLNDLGRIIIYSLDETDLNILQRLTNKESSEVQTVLEETTLGISFPEIGAMLAHKWNFPEAILYAIRYQMKPLHADELRVPLVYPVYMARCMAEVLTGTQKFEFIEFRVLQYFELLDRDRFFAALDHFESLFQSQYEN